MNSSNETRTLVLKVYGLGHVPSFKNTKSIFRNKKTGRMFIATDPKKKEWMERAIKLFVSQLLGLFPIGEGETVGECQKQSQIASSLPLDDSLDWMIPGEQNVVRVPKGEEGAIITITPL